MKRRRYIKIICYKKQWIKKGYTASNGTVCASPPVGGSGFRAARSFRRAPFPRLIPAHFAAARKLFEKMVGARRFLAQHKTGVNLYE
jgi:hypothetical protein